MLRPRPIFYRGAKGSHNNRTSASLESFDLDDSKHAMSDANRLPSAPQLGRTALGHRFALAKLQVLWPLMCCIEINGTIYGFGEHRASSLGLDRKEMLRWWHEYKLRGIAGAIPSGVQAKWKLCLPQLESRLEEERGLWRDAGDVLFETALDEAMNQGNLNQRLKVPKEIKQLWPHLCYSQVEDRERVTAAAGMSMEETNQLVDRIGLCREILIKPLLMRLYTDSAINEYGKAWGSSGATIRLWLDWYKPALGARSLNPSRLTSGQVDWLNKVERNVLDLQVNDVRPKKAYWASLVGLKLKPLASGVASKRIGGDEQSMAATRYEHVKLAVVQHLAGIKQRRNNDQAGLAKALGISEQTLTNWKNDFTNGRSLKPAVITAGMVLGLDQMESVVTTLGRPPGEQVITTSTQTDEE